MYILNIYALNDFGPSLSYNGLILPKYELKTTNLANSLWKMNYFTYNVFLGLLAAAEVLNAAVGLSASECCALFSTIATNQGLPTTVVSTSG